MYSAADGSDAIEVMHHGHRTAAVSLASIIAEYRSYQPQTAEPPGSWWHRAPARAEARALADASRDRLEVRTSVQACGDLASLLPMSEISANGLLVPLEKPPQALSLTVRKIVGKVLAGEIRVPDFQRPLRWQASDVVKLFDSILRGYPIGSLLFWKHALPADPHLKLGSARIDAPAVHDGWLIVDGQQRTTAMAAALSALEQGAGSRWAVRFDPLTNAFLSGAANPQERGVHAPLSALGDLRRLSHWLRDCDLEKDAQDRVEEVQQRLLDYELPAYLMDTDNPDALKGAFARMNSTGVRMRPDEVFHALLGTRSKQQGALNLDALQQCCDIDSFGQPPRGEILKAVLAMSGIDPSRRLDDLEEAALGALVSEDEAVNALRLTVGFLQAASNAELPGAGIPAYGFIPYPVVFVLLSRWFYLFPESDALTRSELSRWLWRGVLSSVHQRAEVSAMRRQARQIVGGELEQSLQALLDAVGEPSVVDWTLERFHANHAASRVELLALLSLLPRDLVGAVSWRALVSDGQRVAREIIASPRWKTLDPSAQSLARTAANRALLDARHTGLRAEFQRWSWEKDAAALESHLIDKVGYDALVAGNDSTFLKHRAGQLRALVSTFLTHKAGLGQPRLRPVETYYEDVAVG